MIIDRLDQWRCYHFGAAWQRTFAFLSALTPDAEEKKYELQGNDLYAMISHYQTRTPEKAILESHRRYVDVQVILSGRERIDVSSRDELLVETPYDEGKDAEFYQYAPGSVLVNLQPAMFALFYPHDAHMPGLMTGNQPEAVKKVVVKIKMDLLTPAKG